MYHGLALRTMHWYEVEVDSADKISQTLFYTPTFIDKHLSRTCALQKSAMVGLFLQNNLLYDT